MTDDLRVYSDEEFAIILRKATELASGPAESPSPMTPGLTLAEMKAAAAQVGFDPLLVERAARLLAVKSAASPLERMIGGPLQHSLEVRFPVALDQNDAERLLSAIRVSAGQSGSSNAGHASAMGLTWHDGGEFDALSITARPNAHDTTITVVCERSGALVMTGVLSGLGVVGSILAGFGASEVAPALFGVTVVLGVSGTFAIARSYWAMSTRKVRERVGSFMDLIGQRLK